MTLKFKRIHPDAQIPAYAHPDDAGMDLRSVEELVVKPGARALVHTGLVMMLPDGYEAQVRPRSGLALKRFSSLTRYPPSLKVFVAALVIFLPIYATPLWYRS